MGLIMYRSEAHFSRQLCKMLTAKVPVVQRIESHETGRGIPDLYLRWKQHEMWIELKNDYRISINDNEWEIKWRKGQQAWMFKYWVTSGRCCYTIVAMKDGYVIIPMNKRYIKNIVLASDVWKMNRLADIYRVLHVEANN